jgi:hypothetical protein
MNMGFLANLFNRTLEPSALEAMTTDRDNWKKTVRKVTEQRDEARADFAIADAQRTELKRMLAEAKLTRSKVKKS